MQETLKTLVTAFALTAVADFVVQQIVMRLLPLRGLYQSYIKLRTVDFSDVRKEGNVYFVYPRDGSQRQVSLQDLAVGSLKEPDAFTALSLPLMTH
eukprot:TRINITY_DN1111_c0_g1_i1.p1 TRINITY_DN1111_c0_g1~~TRINITY_DN1111_c0_g1_i1.p1  ORF type:complete len:96 (+),score=18.17 TRINITY_DN1111_c0_g1_i1:687-974(+)